MTRTRRILAPILAATAAVLVLAAAGAQGAPAAGQGAGAAASTSATGPTGATAPTSTADLTATLPACHPDAVAANRYAIFASQTFADAVPGTLTMSVDFKLEERSAAGLGFNPVKATGFGIWVTSQPHVGIFTYNHEVTALPAPAAFRVLVKARWIGRHRRLLHSAIAFSPPCVQPLLEPDLIVGRITRTAGTTAGSFQYSVEVHNVGNAAAGPFEVSLTIGATALAPISVPGLAAGALAPVVFTGPACTAGNTVTAVADAAQAIDESADSRRTDVVSCPVATVARGSRGRGREAAGRCAVVACE